MTESGSPSRMVERPRVESIDLLRGIVMILMVLDHVRDFFGVPGNPADPARVSAALFFTRWITHLCAPTFFALAGAAAYLAGRQRSSKALSRYLAARGLWLILLELTVLRCFGYQFNLDYRVTFLIILWALGWAMITLSALVLLPIRAAGWFGAVMIAAHNLLDPVRPASFGAFAPLWSILHAPGVVAATPRFVVFAASPLVPWIGVTAAGYAFGRVFEWESDRRRAFLLRLGIALTVGFVVVRGINIYGDPVPWSTQASTVRTLLSYLNATKYPPSLVYLLMTLGPAALLLRALERPTPRFLRPVRVFGTEPLFYFILHLPLIHLLAVIDCYARYGTVHWMFESSRVDQFPVTFPPGWGYSLPVVYALWALVVVLLYPACRWYASRNKGVRGKHTVVAMGLAAAAIVDAAPAQIDAAIAERVTMLTRTTKWTRVNAVPIRFNTFHPQGLVRIGNKWFLSSVEVRDRAAGKGVGHLFKFNADGTLIAERTLGEGAIYHPGGIDYDGKTIWVPVAEYRPDSRAIIYRVDPESMTATEVLRVDDHVGAIVYDTDAAALHGVSWGSRRFYRWTVDRRGEWSSPTRTINPSHYLDYQDCKYVGRHRMVCGGVTEIRRPGDAAPLRLGGIDLVDLTDGRPLHQSPVLLWTPGGLDMTHNPIWLEPAAIGVRAYFMPEDERSTLYVYESGPS